MNNIRNMVLAGRPVEEPLLRNKKRRQSGPSTAAEEESFAELPIRRDAIRQANHRNSDRHRLTDEKVEMIHEGSSQMVKLVNLSGGGAMIEDASDLKLWDRVELRFTEYAHVEADVRWVRGSRYGLEFAQETQIEGGERGAAESIRSVIQRSFPDIFADPGVQPDPPSPVAACQEDPDDDEETEKTERTQRYPLIWSGLLHYDYDSVPVRLRNISEGGALIECGCVLKIGAELLLELDKAGSFFATVNWAHGDTAGLRFHQPFDLQLLASARPTVATQRWVAPDYLRESSASISLWTKQCGRSDLDSVHRPLGSIQKR